MSHDVRTAVLYMNNALTLAISAYKVVYKYCTIMLVYHRLYGMHVDINKFRNLLNGYNSLPERINTPESVNMSDEYVDSLEIETENMYANAFDLCELACELNDKIREFENEHRLMHYELNQELMNNITTITDPEHVQFINEYSFLSQH